MNRRKFVEVLGLGAPLLLNGEHLLAKVPEDKINPIVINTWEPNVKKLIKKLLRYWQPMARH